MPKKFSQKYQPPNQNKRKRKRKTIVKEALGLNNLDDLKQEVLRVWGEYIRSNDIKLKGFAAKEISKYLFPQKREHSGEINASVKVQFININELKDSIVE